MITLTVGVILASCLVLALALLQWGAAQGREHLYFYMTLEKPGSAYFREARSDREQYSRIAVAMIVLVLREVLLASRATGSVYVHGTGGYLWLQAAGLALLAYALLYPFFGSRPLLVVASMVVGGGSLVAGVCAHLLVIPSPISIQVSRIVLGLIGVATFAALAQVPDAKRQLPAWAPLLWVVGPITGLPAIHHAAMVVFYGALALHIHRDTLNYYEDLEAGHHRMQRQHEVIMGFLERVGGAYSAALDLEQVLPIIAAAGADTTSAGAAGIFLVDRKAQDLQMRAAHGNFPPLYRDVPATTVTRRWEELTRMALRQRFAFGEGIIGQTAARRKPQRVPDAREAGILVGSVGDPVRRHAMLAVPLILRDEVLGVMAVLNKRNSDEFSEEDQLLLSTLAEQASFYIDNARMVAALAAQERVHRELQIARDIQRTLLPANAPDVPGFDLNALGRAALEMGGDYYDFFWVSPGQLGLVVADVSGKGVPAALTMAMLRTVMRTHAIADPSAHNVLVRTNAAIVADLPPGTFITVLYGILDIERRVFTWVRAGHEPVLLVRAGHVESHAPGGAAIGVLAPEEFGQALEVQEVALASGDAVVLYTDGITEAMNRDGDEFGPERFLAAVDSAGFSSAERIRHVDESVSAFVGDAPQQDDITLVVLTAR